MFGPRDARPSSGKLIVKVVQRKRPGLDARLQQLRRRPRRRARHDRGVAEGPARRALHPRRPRHDVSRVLREDRRARGRRSRRGSGAEARRARWSARSAICVEATGSEPVVNSTQIRYAYTDRFRFASTKAATRARLHVRPARAGDHGRARLVPHASTCSTRRAASARYGLPRVIRPRKPSRSPARTTERSRSTAYSSAASDSVP